MNDTVILPGKYLGKAFKYPLTLVTKPHLANK